MWTRSVWRCLHGTNQKVDHVRHIKSFIRTERRIMNEKQFEAETRPRTKEVKYNPNDLVADSASRAALQRSARLGEVYDNAMGPSMDETVQKRKVKRLDKLDKTTNMNFVKLLARMRTKSYRNKTRQVLLEGKRLITDGLLAGCKLRTLIYTDSRQLDQLPLVEDEGERILIDKARMALWSLLDAPPGIMAIVERPDEEFLLNDEIKTNRIPLTVVVDGVREPSNMGAIIRTLGAAGCERILLTKGTCDPWEEKVMRTGMGAHFRVPIFTDIQWPRLINYVPENFRVFLADCNSFEVIKEASSYLKDESLQLPGSIDEDESDQFGNTSSEATMIRHDDGTVLQIEPELHRPDLSPEKAHTLPIFEYHEPSYFGPEQENSHCLLIVGGETSSLSASAYQFAHLHSGCKVHISMGNGINSLSTGTALGVIAFEVQRQYRQRMPLKDDSNGSKAIEGKEGETLVTSSVQNLVEDHLQGTAPGVS